MISLRSIWPYCLLGMLLISCSDEITIFQDVPVSDEITQSQADSVNVQIDLQFGFDDKWVWIYINDEIKFMALLSKSVPFSGAQAIFTSNVLRGTNKLDVRWRSLSGQFTLFKALKDFKIGDAEKYYIGLRIYNDTLNVVVQDSTFGYL
ncbi:MAG: hypothetical protein IH949_08600 [Bacteroidetes bacterium]|nr:hypothetical protein [Bacteroidota bacterium]